MTSEGWFDADQEALVPRPEARAPWRDDMLHGRFLAGIAAREVERSHGDDAFLPARLTIDLFKSPPMAPVLTKSERIRDGGRVRVVDVTSVAEGVEISRARVLLLRTSDADVGTIWSPEPWDSPHPEQLDPPSGFPDPSGPWQFRVQADRGMGQLCAKRTWLRDTWSLVAGEALSPFVRVAMVADFSSPLANSGPDGLHLINADINLLLARLPRSDWIGFEVVTHEHEAGVSASTCSVHDLEGAIGTSSVAAVAY